MSLAWTVITTAIFGFWCFSFLCACFLVRGREQDPYATLCKGAVLWTGYLLLMTELLSLFSQLTRRNVFGAWCLFAAAALAGGVYLRTGTRKAKRPEKEKRRTILTQQERFLVLFMAVYLLAGLVLCLKIAPYNWDSMTYHLSRIMFWIEHRSVRYYDTWIDRQLFSPVLAEYVNLHGMLLTDSDLFANLVQFFSFAGCGILLYGTLRRMNCGRTASLLTMFLMMTANLAANESISTQVDMFGSFWLMTFAYLLLKTLQERAYADKAAYIYLGAALGFIYIAKTNIMISAAVLLAFAVLHMLRLKLPASDWRFFFGGAVLSAAAAMLTVLPTWIRNLRYTGDIFASEYVSEIAVGTYAPKYLLVNGLKNVMMLTADRFSPRNEFAMRILDALCSRLQVDINDPLITYAGSFGVTYSLDMDTSGVPVLLPLIVLVILAGIFTLIRGKKATSGGWLIMAAHVQLAAALAVTRGQPWGGILLLPSFVLYCAAVGAALETVFSMCGERTKRLFGAALVIPVLLLYTQVYPSNYLMLAQQRHEPADRFRDYFRSREDQYGYYEQLCRALEKATEDPAVEKVGLFTGGDDYHYPVMVKAKDLQLQAECVELTDDPESSRHSEMNEDYDPDVILAIHQGTPSDTEMFCNGRIYRRVQTDIVDYEDYSLWQKILE